MEHYLKKAEKKLIKLQTKAQECVSREKAKKLIKKYDKRAAHCNGLSEKWDSISNKSSGL